ncbi:MAG: FtsW/RodA/SpoVE family cell cycle protein, partial [bacterium]|nr:FtsW/RodA/SpoVE family cell cycle protein [bacterium]
FQKQDWILYASLAVLMSASLLMMASIGSNFFIQQLISVLIAVVLMFYFSTLNWRALRSYPLIILGIYFVALAALIFTSLFASPIRNARSWLVIGPFQFQVAELMKVAIIILFSYFFAKHHIGIAKLSNILRSFIYLAIPAFFIFLQPDMGTMSVLLAIWVGYLLVSGLKSKHIIAGMVMIVILSAISWSFVLADYQKERIIGFFQPEYDPLGINYSTIQAKIAIGSGSFFGKGFRQGTQTQLGFLPEAASDFVYAAFIEEWGFLGGVVVLIAFLLALFRILVIGMNSDSNFYRLLCLGTSIMFLVQFLLNVGSATGMLPVIGITFPFFSYGGSSIIANSILIGMVQSANRYSQGASVVKLHSSVN